MSAPVVTIKQGALQGKVLKSLDDEDIYSYLGIPYAKPPIGDLRFQAPQPPEGWTGTRDATQHGNTCFSHDTMTGQFAGSEDCLFLNIYTKSVKQTNLTPVMVYIHGGAFTMGSGNSDFFGPEYLLTEDVIMVTINYRTGLLGFLKLEDETIGIPGNAGLKDMVMALKWVKDNIKNFGGDPQNVTIFGESAGSASVHLLYLSEMAKGLFHKTIAQSGCALNIWVPLESHTEDLCKILKVEKGNQKELLEKLKNIPVKELIDAQDQLDDSLYYGTDKRKVGVAVEKQSQNAFINKEPFEIIKKGQHSNVPIMFGYTDKEGILDLMIEKFNMLKNREKFPKNFEYYVPHLIGVQFGSKESKEIAEKIKQFYCNNKELDESMLDIKLDIKTDLFFLRGIYTSVKNHVMGSNAPVYLYRLALDTPLNVFKKMADPNVKGCSHGDDLGYIFKNIMSPTLEPGSPEENYIRRQVKLWANFAKFGNPTPELNNLITVNWKPVTKDCVNYLNIDRELTADVNPEKERMEFWDDIAKKYNPNF